MLERPGIAHARAKLSRFIDDNGTRRAVLGNALGYGALLAVAQSRIGAPFSPASLTAVRETDDIHLNPPHQTLLGSLVATTALFCGLTALATSTGGCFMAAFAVAPIAMQLVRAAGSGIASSTKSARKTNVAQDDEICDMGGRQLPPLIELRTDKLGTTLYRPMTPGRPQSDPQVTAIVNQSGNSGWRLAGNFTTMNFQPPLQRALIPSSITYLAYAPAEVRDPSEQAKAEALNQDFGPSTGTFDWNGRSYRYTVVHQLPCASAPAQENRVQTLSANVTDGRAESKTIPR